MSFEEGSVVICSTGQAGTLTQVIGGDVWVLLANKDLWVGTTTQIRYPQDRADLDACPLEVERLEKRGIPKPNKRSNQEIFGQD